MILPSVGSRAYRPKIRALRALAFRNSNPCRSSQFAPRTGRVTNGPAFLLWRSFSSVTIGPWGRVGSVEENGVSSNCVIIGDVKESRKLDDWETIFTELTKTLTGINRRFSDDIVATFSPTVGDEFQGAISTPGKAFDIYTIMRSELQIDIYCGIGIGRIEKPLNREMGMRGSGFYRAREALAVCKKEKRNVFVKSSDTPNPTDLIINTLLRLIEALENSWTKRQREVVNYYRVHPDYTYEQLSKHFGFSKQAASQFLKATSWEVVAEGDKLVKELLRGMYSREGGGK